MESSNQLLSLIVLLDDYENAEEMFRLSCLPGHFNILGAFYTVGDLMDFLSLQTPDILLVDYFFGAKPFDDFWNQFLTTGFTPVVFLSNFPGILEDMIRPLKPKNAFSVSMKPYSIADYERISKQLHKTHKEAKRLGED